jgi:hypothetical protein
MSSAGASSQRRSGLPGLKSSIVTAQAGQLFHSTHPGFFDLGIVAAIVVVEWR